MKGIASDLAPIIEGLQLQIDALCLIDGDPPKSEILRIAQVFCRMNDDQQAQFFVEVARIMDAWPDMGTLKQAYYIGRHLATCECSTDSGREFVHGIYEAIKQKGTP